MTRSKVTIGGHQCRPGVERQARVPDPPERNRHTIWKDGGEQEGGGGESMTVSKGVDAGITSATLTCTCYHGQGGKQRE